MFQNNSFMNVSQFAEILKGLLPKGAKVIIHCNGENKHNGRQAIEIIYKSLNESHVEEEITYTLIPMLGIEGMCVGFTEFWNLHRLGITFSQGRNSEDPSILKIKNKTFLLNTEANQSIGFHWKIKIQEKK